MPRGLGVPSSRYDYHKSYVPRHHKCRSSYYRQMQEKDLSLAITTQQGPEHPLSWQTDEIQAQKRKQNSHLQDYSDSDYSDQDSDSTLDNHLGKWLKGLHTLLSVTAQYSLQFVF
jgi:hypothetical protein